jgi:RHS repeat-associated protein
VDVRGTTSYSYDNRDRLTAVSYPGGTSITYGYDSEGRRTTLTAKVGATTLATGYSYDELDRIESVTDPGNRVFGLEYDEVGSLSKLVRPNGMDTRYTHDPLNRLTNIRTYKRSTDTTLASYAYTLGPTGIRTRIEEADGTVNDYEYDGLYRLTKETVSGGQPYEKSFSYDAVSNRTKQTSSGAVVDAGGMDATTVDGGANASGITNYSYDNRDRLTAENGTVYSWNANGNLVGKTGEATYEWDFEDRLVKVTKADGTVVENVYDVDGVLVRTVVTPAGGIAQVTDLLVDTSGELSHVVAEIDGSGTVTALYVRAGDRLLEEIRGGVVKMYEADGLGSTRSLLDTTGAQTDTWSYEALGSTVSNTGSDANPYRFAGERLVDSVGFYQNRARWLDTRTGRFVSVDPATEVHEEPITLHRYLYANASPVNSKDPSGLESLAEVQITQVAVMNLGWGVAAGVGIALSPLRNRREPPGPHTMRVQLQRAQFHYDSRVIFDPNMSITVSRFQVDLEPFFYSALAANIPGNSPRQLPSYLESDFLGAVARTSTWASSVQLTGGVSTKGNVHRELFGDPSDKGDRWRLDTENLVGTNLIYP